VCSVKLLGSDKSGVDTVNGVIDQLLKILTVVIRAHDGYDHCHSTGMYTVALTVNFKLNACKK